ncbi:MAG: IS3 family transposase [Prosthecochloris sp.]|nr:IS3 family transposase [Prosthecochloris sp.]
MTETLFNNLKTEWVYGRIFQDRKESRQNIFEQIEVFYNRKRRDPAIGHLSPVDLLNRFPQQRQLAS